MRNKSVGLLHYNSLSLLLANIFVTAHTENVDYCWSLNLFANFSTCMYLKLEINQKMMMYAI